MLHANFVALSFIEPESRPIEVLHCGNRVSSLIFCSSCDLDLDPMIFVYKLDPYSLEMYRMYENELPALRLSKIIV